MNEASKTWALLDDDERLLLSGKGIDIGCGPNPIRPDAMPFDTPQGDANCISRHVNETFDYVFSSHCLEHMRNPRAALLEWWGLVRPGGHLFVVVPDEDLYEQGYWPSIFNADHKVTFTLGKQTSWSPVSVNLCDMCGALPGGLVVAMRLQDDGYNRKWLTSARWPASLAWRFVWRRFGLQGRFPWRVLALIDGMSAAIGLPVDQTLGPAVAQNLIIVRRMV